MTSVDNTPLDAVMNEARRIAAVALESSKGASYTGGRYRVADDLNPQHVAKLTQFVLPPRYGAVCGFSRHATRPSQEYAFVHVYPVSLYNTIAAYLGWFNVRDDS